jgi:hypothetical protein
MRVRRLVSVFAGLTALAGAGTIVAVAAPCPRSAHWQTMA